MSYPTHTISIYLTNQPGSLIRVAQAFARRGFNIDSLVVSPGKDGKFSRMTVTSSGPEDTLEQIIKQVSKLIDVVHCTDHTGENVIERELALIKVAVKKDQRTDVLQIVDHFKADTVDFSDDSLIIKTSGTTEKLDAMLAMLEKYELIELIRTGKLVMARGAQET